MNFEEIRDFLLEPDAFGSEWDAATRAARLACKQVCYGSMAHVDFHQSEKTIRMLAPGFTGTTDGVFSDYEGKKVALRKRQADRERRTRHVCTNYLFRMVDASTARGMYLVTVYLEDTTRRPGISPLTIADCAEEYVKSGDDVWRLSYRYLQPVAGAPR